MNFSDYADLDAVGLSAAIKNGDLSTEEVTEKAIEISQRLNPELNAVVMTNHENAREAARGEMPDSPIAGAPFLLKDVNQFSHDMPTTFSCRFFDGARNPIVSWLRDGVRQD